MKKNFRKTLIGAFDNYLDAILILLASLLLSLVLFQLSKNEIILLPPIAVLTAGILISFATFYGLVLLASSKLEAVELAKKLTSKLSEKTNYLESILTSISEPMIVINKQTHIQSANREAHNWFTFSPNTPLENILETSSLPKSTTIPNILRKIEQSKKEYVIQQVPLSTREGKKYVNIVFSPVFDDKKLNFFTCTINDITYQVELQKSKDEFVSIVSHQLKTPITALNWNLELLQETDKKKQREVIETITETGHSLNSLINALLNIGRIESGRITIDVQPIQLQELIDTVVNNSTNNQNKNAQFTIDIDSKLTDAVKLHSDPSLLEHVLMNIITNALKYSEADQPIHIQAHLEADQVLITIEDRGKGIPEKEQQKLFSKFFRASNIANTHSGTGLGLYLVKIIVNILGGNIWFVSSEEHGTSFYLQLPLKGLQPKEGTITLSSS